MEGFCCTLTNSTRKIDSGLWTHFHVDVVNIIAACSFASVSVISLFILRSARCNSNGASQGRKPVEGRTLRGIFMVLSLLSLFVDFSDFFLDRRQSLHVLSTPVATLVTWLTAVILYHHVETRRRSDFLVVSGLGWLCCGVSRFIRLSYLMDIGLGACHLRPLSTVTSGVLFAVLTLIDLYAFYVEAHFKKGIRPRFSKKDDRNLTYHHYNANFFSKVTFYWLMPLLRVGYANPLELEDLGELPLQETTEKVYNKFHAIYEQEKRSALREHRSVSLWSCYMKSCWLNFSLGGVLKLLGDCVGFVGPLGIPIIVDYLSRIQHDVIEDIECDNHTNYCFPKVVEFLENGYIMSVIIFISCLAQGTFSQTSTHLVNVEGIHLKGALQALVYGKALRLCAWSISDAKDSEDLEGSDQPNGMLKQNSDAKKVDKVSSNKIISNADVGTITNLMSEDAFNIMSFFWIGHYVWAIPLKIGVLMYLLYIKLGISAIIGAMFCILTMTPLQFIIGYKMSSNSKAITEISDERLRKMNEVVQGIKLLKLYGWECVYGTRISETREKELKLLNKDSLYWAIMTFLTQASSVLVTLVTFGFYVHLEGTSMSAGNVFAGLALFNQLTVPLFIFPITIPIIISARLSTKRLEDFLALPETSNPSTDDAGDDVEGVLEVAATKEVIRLPEAAPSGGRGDRSDSVYGLGNIMENEEEPDEEDEMNGTEGNEEEEQKNEDVTVSVKNGSFSWSGDNVFLSTISFVISTGKLTLVVGKVGSGKTSLLSALLGEMHVTNGKVHWQSGDSIAYAAQKPWLLNGTLRDNILFGQPYKPRRYNRVIVACALQPDIDILPGKDLTEIGEKGINLSGGQKQRISIARTIYTQASVVIMDDPLSSLDDQVGQQVFESGIKSLLLRQRRTVILVTHRLQLLPHAHKIIALENGKIRAHGSLNEIEASDSELANTWKAIMKREALEEQAKGRTAKERWQLVKLVSRIGVQLKQRHVVDGSWQSEEQVHVTQPTFVPFRKRLGTFSGSRYFSHDLPLPTDECEDEFIARPTRPSIKRNRVLVASSPLGVSALPQHKQVIRSSSLQIHDNLRYPVVRQHSSPSIQHEQLNSGPCRARNYTLDNTAASQESLLHRILSLKNKRNVIVTTASEEPISSVGGHNVLKRLLSSGAKPVVMTKPEQFRSKRGLSTSSAYSDDFLDDDDHDNDMDTSAGRLVADEEREYGKISRRIYYVYLCACGVVAGLGYVFSTLVWHALRVYTDVWLSEWAEKSNATGVNSTGIGMCVDTENVISLNDVQDIHLDQEVASYYFSIYAVLSVISILLSLISNGIGQYAGAQARRTLHNKMLRNILRCPMRFFETTPVGRIINRFSTDMAVIDKKIATSIQRLLQFSLMCFSAILLNAVVSHWFLVAAVPLCIIYFFIQRFYRSSARELQRLDSITRSPIFSHFSETLGGLTTIRAYSQQRRFTEMLYKKMDAHTNVFLIINTGNRWLGIALDYLGGVVVFLAILAALLSATFLPGRINPAMIGLAINYTLLVPIYLNWVVKFVSDMEMYMGAVERIEQYSLTTSDDYRDDGISVPLTWPEKGDIVFDGVSLRYDINRDPVVSNLNLHIPAGQKVGICGRSGSGKSSLVMSLFNMIDVFEGSILIDGVDIKRVPLQVLRSRLSIIPQDVLMFSGTIRSNLDPSSRYSQHSDDKLWMSLELAQLKDIVTKYPGGLDGEVREGGENLSAGERQLFCLARAILHDAACLVMDEATSSIDPATEKALLAAATKAFASRTVITIAHRLPTILNCDRILVLDGGRVVEDGTPTQLLNRSMGIFSSMLRASEE